MEQFAKMQSDNEQQEPNKKQEKKASKKKLVKKNQENGKMSDSDFEEMQSDNKKQQKKGRKKKLAKKTEENGKVSDSDFAKIKEELAKMESDNDVKPEKNKKLAIKSEKMSEWEQDQQQESNEKQENGKMFDSNFEKWLQQSEKEIKIKSESEEEVEVAKMLQQSENEQENCDNKQKKKRKLAKKSEENGKKFESEEEFDFAEMLQQSDNKQEKSKKGKKKKLAKKSVIIDPEFAKLLEQSDNEQEQEDSKQKEENLLLKKEFDRGSGGFHFEKDDIVWFLEIKQNNKRRSVKDSDMKDLIEGNEISGGIYVINDDYKEENKTKSKKSALISPVYVYGASNNNKKMIFDLKDIPTKVANYEFLHIYEKRFGRNDEIFKAIKSSKKNKVDMIETKDELENIEKQIQRVADFQITKLHHERSSEIRALNYLCLDLAGSQRYMSNFTEYKPIPTVIHVPKKEVVEEKKPKEEPVEDFFDDLDDDTDIMMAKPVVINEDVIEIFQSRNLKTHLRKVMHGKIESRRHEILMEGGRIDLSIRSELFHIVNNCILDPENDNETHFKLFDLCTPLYKEEIQKMKSTLWVRSDFMQHYIDNCLIPEGVIWYLSKKHKWSLKHAAFKYLPLHTQNEIEFKKNSRKRKRQDESP